MTKKSVPHILLVDDDKNMCVSLADVITLDSGLRVSYATNPAKALKMIKKGDFSLVISDFKMPGMNGIEFIQNIKKINPKIITFILTAFITTELIEHAKKAGASKVLSKFVWPDEILRHIKNTLDKIP